MKQRLLGAFLAILIVNLSNAQNDSVKDDKMYEFGPCPNVIKDGKNLVLTDKKSGIRFVLDSARISITASSANGKQLWQTHPKASYPAFYPHESAQFITRFCFVKNKYTKWSKVIWISFDDNQFGYINLSDGKYTRLGKD